MGYKCTLFYQGRAQAYEAQVLSWSPRYVVCRLKPVAVELEAGGTELPRWIIKLAANSTQRGNKHHKALEHESYVVNILYPRLLPLFRRVRLSGRSLSEGAVFLKHLLSIRPALVMRDVLDRVSGGECFLETLFLDYGLNGDKSFSENAKRLSKVPSSIRKQRMWDTIYLLLLQITYLHARNILHRDVKNENILLQHVKTRGQASADGVPHKSTSKNPASERSQHNVLFPVLIDFEMAMRDQAFYISKGRGLAGTYGYIAPEKKQGYCSALSDLFSLGVTLCELFVHPGAIMLSLSSGLYSDRLVSLTFEQACQLDASLWVSKGAGGSLMKSELDDIKRFAQALFKGLAKECNMISKLVKELMATDDVARSDAFFNALQAASRQVNASSLNQLFCEEVGLRGEADTVVETLKAQAAAFHQESVSRIVNHRSLEVVSRRYSTSTPVRSLSTHSVYSENKVDRVEDVCIVESEILPVAKASKTHSCCVIC